jgi:acyl dehydratase
MSSKARPVRYFEDYPVGARFDGGPILVDAAEIVAFATRYDPQSFHVDPDAASRSFFGGLIASGWHTAALTMRLLVEHYLSEESSLGSPGIDELRWIKPVRPGDALSVRVVVDDARRSRSRPDRGVVHSSIEVRNQRDETVMTLKAMSLIGLRNPGADTQR